MAKYCITNPIFKPSPINPHFDDYLIFEGISVDEHTGEQYYLDAHVAYRRACLNAIEYLKKFGYTGEQTYMTLGTAPVERAHLANCGCKMCGGSKKSSPMRRWMIGH